MRVRHKTAEQILPVQAVHVHLGPAHRRQAHAEPDPLAQLLCEKDRFKLCRQSFREGRGGGSITLFDSLMRLRTPAEEVASLRTAGEGSLQLQQQQMAGLQHGEVGREDGGRSRPSQHGAAGCTMRFLKWWQHFKNGDRGVMTRARFPPDCSGLRCSPVCSTQ